MTRVIRMISVVMLAALLALIVVPARAVTPGESGMDVAVPEGPGSFGPASPEPMDTAAPSPDCDAGDDGETELGELKCGRSNRGAECMVLCAEYGVSCPAGKKHTKTNEMAPLYKCCNCKGNQRCWYATDSGGTCVLRPETGGFVCD